MVKQGLGHKFLNLITAHHICYEQRENILFFFKPVEGLPLQEIL